MNVIDRRFEVAVFVLSCQRYGFYNVTYVGSALDKPVSEALVDDCNWSAVTLGSDLRQSSCYRVSRTVFTMTNMFSQLCMYGTVSLTIDILMFIRQKRNFTIMFRPTTKLWNFHKLLEFKRWFIDSFCVNTCVNVTKCIVICYVTKNVSSIFFPLFILLLKKVIQLMCDDN